MCKRVPVTNSWVPIVWAFICFELYLIRGEELFSTQFHCFANNSLVTSSIIDLRPDSRALRAGLFHTVLRIQKTVFEGSVSGGQAYPPRF
jgi:hypothetical protein